MVYRRSTLYGLPIVVGRRMNLAPIDPAAARDMLIEHGLVAGEWSCREKFYLHNQELLADMHELAQRTRQREYIVDKYQLARFYGQRIPADVTDLGTLRSWLVKHQGQPHEQALWMKPEDLLESKSEALEEVAEAYPNSLPVGTTNLPLTYVFEPGHAADGVCVTVPQAALRQISDESLGWLVPGLLEDKILHLIRSLPKPLRVNFVPAPDVANKLAKQLSKMDRQKPFSAALCEVMTAHAGEPMKPSHFDWSKTPEHLQFLVRVVDDHGELIESGRNVAELQSRHAPPESLVTANKVATSSDWRDRRITQIDFDTLPQQIGIKRGGVVVSAFPALIDVGDAVELRLVDNAAEAERQSIQGWMRLFSLKHNRHLRSQVSHLPNFEKHSLLLGHILKAEPLRNQLADLIARIAFIDGRPPLSTRDDFEVRNMRAVEQLSIATQHVATWLPKLAESAHQVRLRVEAIPATWREVSEDIRQQLSGLLASDFLKATPWSALTELPRYLKAIELRLDKLKNGGLPKDRQLRAPIEKAVQRYQQLCSKTPPPSPEQSARLDELRWLIEEFRVSIFAQSLGTKQTVSEKRINDFINSLS
jgi:ATP-dependent helicase HrpA